MPETVLVTGGAGFVGAHIVVELAREGFAPVVLDNFSNSTPAVRSRLEALAGRPVPCVTADVRDVVALRTAFHDHPIAAVVHCAGLKNVAESEARPLAYYDVNVGGTLALIEVMGEAGVATLVFSSAAAVYGDANDLRLAEDTPLQTASVYGRTKRVVEDILRDLSKANANWRMAIVRKFNPAGGHSSGMLGEAPRGRATHLFPQLCRVAAGEASELVVHGDDWDTADGTGVRDFVHVQDLAEGFVRALRHVQAKPGVLTVNLGSGKATSVMGAIAAFERACGRSIPRVTGPRRAGDVAGSCADIERAATVLDWRPTRDLEAICADAWRWQKNGGRY
jgi:UDP-glucose 4-epimerase